MNRHTTNAPECPRSRSLRRWAGAIAGCALAALPAAGARAADAGVAIRVAHDFAAGLIGKDAADDLLSALAAGAKAVRVVPAACDKALADATVAEGESTAEGGAAAALWRKVGGLAPCQTLGIEIDVPESDVVATLFFSGIGVATVPTGHVALALGPQTLNSGFATDRVFKAFPVLNADRTAIHLTRAVAIISAERAVVRPGNLAGAVGDAMAPYADGDGNVTLEQGVNVLGAMANPTTGHLAAIARAALPGIENARDDWQISGVFGGDLLELAFGKLRHLARLKTADYDDKKSLAFTLGVPAYTPFPFDKLNRPDLFHVKHTGTQLAFSLARSLADGQAARTLTVAVRDASDYTVLGKTYPVTASGDVTWDGHQLAGHVSGEYALPDDPLGFGGGIRITHLLAEGGIAVEPGKRHGETVDLSAGVGLRIEAGGQPLESRFTLNLREQGGRVDLVDAHLSLGGEGGQGTVSLASIPALGKVPLVNEWVLEQGVLGIAPRRGKSPEFYLAGGATWTRTQLGGRFAFLLKDEKAYLIAKLNRFSLAGLLPPGSDYDPPRNVLTALSVPEALLVLTNDKNENGLLAREDIPPPLQDLFDGYVADAAPGLRIYGDGLTVTTRVVLPDGGDDDLSRAFRQMGLTGFTVKNPLLVSGSIGGLASGKPSLSIAALLPEIQLPKRLPGNVLNPLAGVVYPGQMSFYLALEAAGAPALEVGMRGGIGLRVPDLSALPAASTRLDMDGKLFFKADTTGKIKVQAAGHLAEWKNAFGIAGLSFIDPAITLAVAAQAETTSVGIEFGVGGDVAFADRSGRQAQFAADAYLGAGVSPDPPYVIPQALGFNLGATELSPDTMILVGDVLLRGVLAGPLSEVLVKALPDARAKAALTGFQQRLQRTSLGEVLQVDKLPLPLLILKKAQGEDKARIYFATPGVEIPGREASGLSGVGLLTNAAVFVRLLGQDHPVVEAKLNLSTRGLELLGKLPAVRLGALSIGKPGREPTLDVQATTDALPHFRLKGALEIAPVFDDEIDFEVSQDALRFLVQKKLAGVYELALDARTNGASVASSTGFRVDAALTNNIDDFIDRQVLPKLGVPPPVVAQIAHAAPVRLKQVALHGDLVDLVRGGSMQFSASPEYFGTPRQAPAITGSLVGVTWDDPLKFLGNEALLRLFVTDFVDFLASHPRTLGAVEVGPIGFTGGVLGGVANAQGGRSFVIRGGLRLPLSAPQAEMVFDRSAMRMTFTDTILDGLLSTRFEVSGAMRDGLPVNPEFVGTATGDASAWLVREVGKVLGRNAVGQAVAREIGQADLVTVTAASLKGNYADYFGQGRPAELQLTLRVLGKYQHTAKQDRVRVLNATIPLYARPNPATLAALEPTAAQVAQLLIDDAAKEVAAAGLEPVAEIFQGIAHLFRDLQLVVARNALAGQVVRVRKLTSLTNEKRASDLCLSNLGGSGAGVQIRVGPCDGSKNQLFAVSYDASGRFLTLRDLASNQCLDINGTALAAPAIQNACTPRGSIEWSFAEKPSARGIGMLVNHLSQRCLDLKDGVTRTGQGMQTWDCSVLNMNQYFWIEEVALAVANAAAPMARPLVVEGGLYSFRAAHSGRCLDNAGGTQDGLQTHQWDCNGANSAQQWLALPALLSPNHFQFKSQRSGKCLDVDAGVFQVKEDGRKIQQWDCHIGDNQKWEVVYHNAASMDGTVSLRSQASGKCVDLDRASPANGAPFFQHGCHWGANQRFHVELLR